MLAVAILGAVLGIGFAGLDQIGAVSSNTAANLGLVSLGCAVVATLVGRSIRHRARLANEGMYVGLATLGGWLLLVLYALAQDTP